MDLQELCANGVFHEGREPRIGTNLSASPTSTLDFRLYRHDSTYPMHIAPSPSDLPAYEANQWLLDV